MSKDIEFVRDKKTGKLLIYKNGEYQGEMITMGDTITGTAEEEVKDERNIYKLQKGRTVGNG